MKPTSLLYTIVLLNISQSIVLNLSFNKVDKTLFNLLEAGEKILEVIRLIEVHEGGVKHGAKLSSEGQKPRNATSNKLGEEVKSSITFPQVPGEGSKFNTALHQNSDMDTQYNFAFFDNDSKMDSDFISSKSKLTKTSLHENPPSLATTSDSRGIVCDCGMIVALSNAKNINDLITIEGKCHEVYKKYIKNSPKGPLSVQEGWIIINQNIRDVYKDLGLIEGGKPTTSATKDNIKKTTYSNDKSFNNNEVTHYLNGKNSPIEGQIKS